jgi:uncharacterized protein with HEPN domain
MPSQPSRSCQNARRDIIENIELARGFVAGFSLEEFQADRRTVYAVTRCLEIISEASRKLPPALKSRRPDIPWTDIAGAGNIYRHHYQNVREDILWHTITERLIPLYRVTAEELSRLAQ